MYYFHENVNLKNQLIKIKIQTISGFSTKEIIKKIQISFCTFLPLWGYLSSDTQTSH